MLLVEPITFLLLFHRQRLLLGLLLLLQLRCCHPRRGLLQLRLLAAIEIGRFLRLPHHHLLPLLQPRLFSVRPARHRA